MTLQTTEAKRYDQGMWLLERLSLLRLRRTLLREVRGDVLEIGAGTGANLKLYPAGTRVLALDVEASRLAGAAHKALRHDFAAEVGVGCADAHDLPLPDAHFDYVVSTLVFCSIPEPLQALQEIKRVLRPNGRLLMLEHVRGQNFVTRRLTDWLHPAWFALQRECHLNRETAATVRQAGFELEEAHAHAWGVLQIIRAWPQTTPAVEK